MVSKSKEEKRRKISQVIRLHLFWLSFFGIIFGLYTFHTGFHNVDICHNEALISEAIELELSELALDGSEWSLTECYLVGLKQTLIGTYVILISSISFGAGLVELFELRKP